MPEYTPTTENIRNCYVYSPEQYDGSLATPVYVATAEFNRWLAAHDAGVAAKAWYAGAHAVQIARVADKPLASNPHRALVGHGTPEPAPTDSTNGSAS